MTAHMSAQHTETKTLSITSMVLGIASLLFGWTFLVPIAGVICGFMGMRREPAGKGFWMTGLVLNGLALIGWIIGLVVLMLLGGAFFGLSLFV